MVIDEQQHPQPTLIQTGVEGLDEVLRGGLVANRLYLIKAHPARGRLPLPSNFSLQASAAARRACTWRSPRTNRN
jgi:KaiC/GvpD/RAD55 family RecA-like ATPase